MAFGSRSRYPAAWFLQLNASFRGTRSRRRAAQQLDKIPRTGLLPSRSTPANAEITSTQVLDFTYSSMKLEGTSFHTTLTTLLSGSQVRKEGKSHQHLIRNMRNPAAAQLVSLSPKRYASRAAHGPGWSARFASVKLCISLPVSKPSPMRRLAAKIQKAAISAQKLRFL